MFESFSRGFRMIWASVKMGWQDKRLLIPSILTVFTNMLFGCIFFLDGVKQMGHQAGGMGKALSPHGMEATIAAAKQGATPSHGMLGIPASPGGLLQSNQINGPSDMSGLQAFSFEHMQGFFTTDNIIIVSSLMMMWWLTNRFLEGVTTAMVYSHLTEGKGSGKFSEACAAVFQSLPAIVCLGLATLVCKKIASFLRNKNHAGALGMGFNFLAGIVEVFWTLAGHLILPAIVIEGCSFWGGLKRADKIAQGSLLTIGVGEVGVDLICRVTTWGIWAAGGATLGGAFALAGHPYINAPIIIGVAIWGATLIFTTALSIYIRSAFYTCLYVWAIELEDMEEADKAKVRAPGPLAAALA